MRVCRQDLSFLLYIIGILDAFDDDDYYYDACGAPIDTLIGASGDVDCESAKSFINNLHAHPVEVVIQLAYFRIRIRMPARCRLCCLPRARRTRCHAAAAPPPRRRARVRSDL